MMQLLDHRGQPIAASDRRDALRALASTADFKQRYHRILKAKYDAAGTTDENERHWANADFLSANASLRWGIRRRIRSRARYEAQENNSYAKGMILTLANDLVGTGPRLNLRLKDKAANRRINKSFDDWTRATGLAQKLRTMRMGKVTDGEAFALFTSNPRIQHAVKLDLQPIESDLFDIPWEFTAKRETEEFEGIKFDRWKNPTSYYLLKDHPGSLYNISFYEGDWIDADYVAHLFRPDRSGQSRGISEIVTALPLFAMLRRFTLATLAAAETAASYAGVMQTNSGASSNCDVAELSDDEWFEAIPLEYRALLTLPQGWQMSQLKAEHPTTTYPMFKQELINEIARCLNMPYNVAAANSSSYNYASGRMDHQVYYSSIKIEQHDWEVALMDRVFRAWCDEAVFVKGLLPDNVGPVQDWAWQWFWDRPEHVDPEKESKAQGNRLANGTSSRAREYQRQGLDIDEEDEIAAESYGVSVEEYRRALFQKHMAAGGSPDQAAEPQQPDPEEQEARS